MSEPFGSRSHRLVLSRRQFLAAFPLGAAALSMSRLGIARGAQPNAISVAPGLSVWPRETWGADLPPTGPLEPEKPRDVRFLLVHHTATSNDYRQGDVPTVIRDIYGLHTGPDKGWSDIAYNFFVDRYGGVWEARDGSLEQPIKADATGGSQGFAVLGCFLGDHQAEPPTDAAVNSMVLLLAWLAGRYEIDPSPGAKTTFVSRGSNRWPKGTTVEARTISGHRDMSQTVCPGDFVYSMLERDIPLRVTRTLESIGGSLAPPGQSQPGFGNPVIRSSEPPPTVLPEQTVVPTPARVRPTIERARPAAEVDRGDWIKKVVAILAGGLIAALGGVSIFLSGRSGKHSRPSSWE